MSLISLERLRIAAERAVLKTLTDAGIFLIYNCQLINGDVYLFQSNLTMWVEHEKLIAVPDHQKTKPGLRLTDH